MLIITRLVVVRGKDRVDIKHCDNAGMIIARTVNVSARLLETERRTYFLTDIAKVYIIALFKFYGIHRGKISVIFHRICDCHHDIRAKHPV